jgi:hypothetical protein
MSSSYEYDKLKEVLKEEKGLLNSIKATSREKNSRILRLNDEYNLILSLKSTK